jgi:dihydroflavonol-4-reductase
MTAPVLVTGATGFLASRIIERLLGQGRHVRGTVRSLTTSTGVDMVSRLPGAADRLELVEADLTRPGSFDAPAAGCAGVIHTASPYVLDVKDPQRDLVDPAVNGTREVLAACVRAGTVTRVVLTSSMAAVTDEPERDKVLTETDWNEKSSLDRNPYYYSKTMAERAAWSFIADTRPTLDLIVINPFMMIGPSLTPGINTSNQLFVSLMNGAFPAIVSMAWGFVDVRDAAEAHVLAMDTPGAHGRYICAGDVVPMRTLVALLVEHGYGMTGRLPTRSLESPLGTWLARLASYRQPKGTGQYLRTHLGRVPRYDTTKIRTELGVSFRPASVSILDTMQDLERWGHLPKQRRSPQRTAGS